MEFSTAFSTMFESGVDSLWRTIAAMPAEKLDWRPEPTTRTARELLEELLMSTTFSTEWVRTQAVGNMDKEFIAPKDIHELETEYRAAVKSFLEAVKDFPDAKYPETFTLPWGKSSFSDIISYPYWNLIYHWGQISYLQTMYGDTEIH